MQHTLLSRQRFKIKKSVILKESLRNKIDTLSGILMYKMIQWKHSWKVGTFEYIYNYIKEGKYFPKSNIWS
jgi:hypothetical protein